MKVSDRIVCDDENDIVLIDGHRVSARILNEFFTVSPPGRWFRIINRDDGVVTIETKQE